MNWLTKLFSTGAKELTSGILDGAAKLAAGHLGKKELQLELEKMIATRDMAIISQATQEISSKEKILVAELQQGDAYTKRARPTLVYSGLVAMIVQGIEAIPFTAPEQFWAIWGGVCGVWIIGRSAEKIKGNGNKVVRAITGSKLLEG